MVVAVFLYLNFIVSEELMRHLEKLRNIGVMAHIDAGKTTVSERILYYTGKTYKMGEVHEGTAVMDFMEEEQKRGITITSAATSCPWKDHIINLIDTPGHIDFTAEVERSLRVLDGAIAVFDSSEGVQAQSETVWRQGQKYHLPCLCFVNKMDKVGADFDMCVESIRNKLVANPIPMQVPIGSGDSFSGIIDLILMKAVFYEASEMGAKFKEEEIPATLKESAQHHRQHMIESVAEFDDELMDCFLEDKPISELSIRKAIRKGTLANKVNPVLVGSALKYIGVQRLLDAVVAYLPSPLDKADIVGHDGRDQNSEVVIRCDPDRTLVALAFKITSDVHGGLSFLRLYQGSLKSGTRVLNVNRDKKENVTRIYEMHAGSRKSLDVARAGDIVAVVGLKQTLTGDTVCDVRKPVSLPSISFPDTVISMSIEPRSTGDKAKLAEALAAIRREDPTFSYRTDSETGQTVISGMGELHLEVLQNKLVKEMKVNVRIGTPRVAYKEAITRTAQAEGKFVRQTGGRGQFGHVVIEIEPLRTNSGHWASELEFESKVISGSVPKEYWGAVQRGIEEAISNGVLAGYPVVGIKASLLDGSYHTVDSSDIAFEQAAAIAVEKAMKSAGPVLLEPVMYVQVVVPEANFGVVQADLLARRGMITDSHIHGEMRVIDAQVPLVEMFGYSSQIRSLTAGRGSFTMEPRSYEKIPEQIAKQITL